MCPSSTPYIYSSLNGFQCGIVHHLVPRLGSQTRVGVLSGTYRGTGPVHPH